MTDATGRLARGKLRLVEYDYEFQYRPGRKHSVADGISRLPTDVGDCNPIDEDLPCFVISKGQYHEDDQEETSGLWDDNTTDFLELPEVLALTSEETNVMPVTVEEFLREQATNPFCKAKDETVGDAKSEFDIDRY